MLSFALIQPLFDYACNSWYRSLYVKLKRPKNSAYGRVNFEGCDLVCFHRLDAGFPNFQLKFLADVQFHRLVVFATVVQHRSVIITVSGLVVECQLQRNSLTMNTNIQHNTIC